MRATETAGDISTIVVDITGVRRASGLVGDAAHAFAVLASRVRGHPLPAMPPGVDGAVSGELAAVAAELGAIPQPLVDVAQELRVRAFWAEIADRLMGGYDLQGAQLTEFKAAYASGLLTRYAEPWQVDLAAAYAKQVHDREHPSGFMGFVHGVGDFFEGAWDAIKDPAVMIYRLTPLSDGWEQHWSDLGHGLEYGVTHPLEFGKAIINIDALEQRGFAYWIGNLAPAAAATLLSGGAAAGVRGAEGAAATERILAGASGAERVAEGEQALAATGRLRALFAADHTWTYDVLHPGPLTPSGLTLDELRRSPAQTFASGKYDLGSSHEPYVVFRAGEHPGGRFFTFDPPVSEAQTRIDSAVKPVWTTPEGSFAGSSPLPRGYAFVVENPGHAVPIGPVGEQGGVYLGGPDKIQVYIDDRQASSLRKIGEWSLHDPPDWVRTLTEGNR